MIVKRRRIRIGRLAVNIEGDAASKVPFNETVHIFEMPMS